MGLFDLFKKKKTADDKKESFVADAGNGKTVKVEFSGIQSAPSEYEVWPKVNGNSDNEYANAVFLSIHKGKPHKIDSVAHLSWLSYKLGIKDPVRKYKDMLAEGYFREARPDEILDTYRVAEIKEMLSEYGIEASGKKADLVAALLEAVPAARLRLPALFRLSSKGWEYMEQNQDLIDLFRNPYGITYKEYMEAKDTQPYLKYNDIVWGILNKREISFLPEEYALRNRNREYRGDFLKREGKYASALAEYLSVVYYEINDRLNIYNHVSKDTQRTFELSLADHYADLMYELREHYKEGMATKAARNTIAKKKYISGSDFENFIEELLLFKNKDFSKLANR